MKKKLLFFTLMLVLVVCTLAISVSAVEKDGLYYSLNTTNKTASLTIENGTSCELEIVNIPETITIDNVTYTVTSIDRGAFAGATNSPWPGNTKIKEVSIPASVTSIGMHAFRNCTSITKVKIVGPATFGGDAEFYNCSSLVELDLSGMTNLTKLGNYLCDGCKSLTTLKLPETNQITSIGSRTFAYCAFTSFEIPETVTTIGSSAFNNCKLTSIVIPDSVTNLGDYAFQGSTSLTSVKLSKNLTYLGKNNFQSTKIKEIVIPATLTQIQNHVFHSSSLERVVFASTQVTSFNSQAFDGAGSLKILFYPGATEEEARAFAEKSGKLKGFTNYISYEDYDPNASYTSTIVYGTSNCENCHDLVGDSALYATDTVSKIVEKIVCEACGYETVVSEMNAPIKYLGFSKNMAGTSLCIGYEIDFDALAKYEELTGKAITWGVVGYAPKEYDDKNALKPVKDDLSLQDAGTTIFAPLERTYKSFEFKISGFSASTKDSELVMCAYVSDGSTVSYLNINQESNTVAESEYATLITYNKYE